MNDFDKKDLLELANIIKDCIVELKKLETNKYSLIFENITGCADTIIEIVENKPIKIERMF